MENVVINLFLVMSTCLCFVSGQAPGDHDATCRTGLYANNHIFPTEWRVLVDTYDYQNLYNQLSFPSPPWTANDVDGDSLNWMQLIGGLCTWSVRTCTQQATQNNWLFSQHISYETANEVFFNVTFGYQECVSRPSCTKPYVTLYQYNRDTIAPSGERINPSNYQLLFGDAVSSRLEQPASTTRKVGDTRSLTRPVNSVGFYLGIRDEGTCGSIDRMIVYYVVCPARQEGLVTYPETAVPVQGSSDIIFDAICALNSYNTTTLQVTAFSSSSSCSPMASGGARCECNAGYVISGGGTSCEGT